MTEAHAGGCLCGAVRFHVIEAPLRTTICHCTFCQRMTGAGYLVEPIFNAEAFEITKGTPSTYDHRSDESGKRVTIHFCPLCGTRVRLGLERFDGVVGVFGGAFDDPNWFDREGETVRHVFARSAQRGTVLPAGIDIYLGHAMPADGSEPKLRRLQTPQQVGPEGGHAE